MLDDWKIVLVSTLPQDIYLAQGFLESEGISTLLQDELTAQVNNFYSNAIGGVKLLVHADNVEQALALLRSAGYVVTEQKPMPRIEFFYTTDFQHCPYCGSDNIAKQKNVDWFVLIIYALFGALFPIFKPVYTCFDCDRTWRFGRSKNKKASL